MARIICLIGGESTGKSTLSRELQVHLADRHGLSCSRVDEHLRTWCQNAGRAPLAHEQAALARTQAELISEAASSPTTDVVIADTSALVVAAYSELYFGDHSLWNEALDRQRGYDLTLLMGLDLPWVPDGLFRESPTVRADTDRVIRRELTAAGLAFHTIYGSGPQRLQHALRPISRLLGTELAEPLPPWGLGQATWQCERCSDPACEHRLFSRLLNTR
ncbi:MAG: AAA family ATPase [Gammaproteobacteria bacterium]